MKTLSFRDLKLAEELSHLNEIEMLSIDNDDVMLSVLKKCGFDTDYGIAYIPSKHRDMQGKIAIGFQAVGDVTLNRDIINTSVCDMTDRLVAASYQDPSRAREMAGMMGGQIRLQSLLNDEDAEEEDFPNELIEDDCDWVTTQIKQLEAIRDQIRGTMYNEAGALKTLAEYKKK